MTVSAQPTVGLGAVLSIGTQGGSPAYTPVGKIKTIKAPQPKFGTDVSVLWESADAGQVAVLAAFATISNSANGADYPFKLALPVNLSGGETTTADIFTFSGLVTDYSGPELQPDKTITWSFKVKIDGAITFAEGS
jgi:hypothetical protein